MHVIVAGAPKRDSRRSVWRMNMRRTSIMTAVALIVMGGGLGHVAPKFGEIFSELYAGELALPALTQIVLALAPFGWVALGVVGALIVIVKDIALPSRKLPNWPYVVNAVLECIFFSRSTDPLLPSSLDLLPGPAGRGSETTCGPSRRRSKGGRSPIRQVPCRTFIPAILGHFTQAVTQPEWGR